MAGGRSWLLLLLLLLLGGWVRTTPTPTTSSQIERPPTESEEVKYTDKKENKIFIIYKEIQMGSSVKSYKRKGFVIYEEMRKYFPKYEEALVIYDFAANHSEFSYI